MKNTAFVLLAIGFLTAAGILAYKEANSQFVHAYLAKCGYVPHPVADVGWELYANRGAHIGSAVYFSIMTRSENAKAMDCAVLTMPAYWKIVFDEDDLAQ